MSSFPPGSPEDRDAALRQILDDVAAGRVGVDDALWQIKNLTPAAAPAQVQAVTALLGPMLRRGNRVRSGGVLIAGIIMMLFGAVFVAVGLLAGWRSLQLLNDNAVADGVVVRMFHDDGKSKPLVKYTVNGVEHELVGAISSSPPAFSVGEKVQVVYRPGDPSYAVIDAFVERWLFLMIFCGVGGVVCLAGCGMVLYRIAALFRPKPLDESQRFAIE